MVSGRRSILCKKSERKSSYLHYMTVHIAVLCCSCCRLLPFFRYRSLPFILSFLSFFNRLFIILSVTLQTAQDRYWTTQERLSNGYRTAVDWIRNDYELLSNWSVPENKERLLKGERKNDKQTIKKRQKTAIRIVTNDKMNSNERHKRQNEQQTIFKKKMK